MRPLGDLPSGAASFRRSLARTMTLRVRLDFHNALKLSELQQSWMVVPEDIQLIGDLYGHLVRTYSLRKQARHPTHAPAHPQHPQHPHCPPTPPWPTAAFAL